MMPMCRPTPLLLSMQVHNALGYAYFNMGKTDIAIAEYKQAVEKQPGCVQSLQA